MVITSWVSLQIFGEPVMSHWIVVIVVMGDLSKCDNWRGMYLVVHLGKYSSFPNRKQWAVDEKAIEHR